MNNKKRNPRLYLIFLAVVSAALAGCSAIQTAEEAVADVEQRTTDTRVFRIDASVAQQVILDSIAEGWPDKSPAPLAEGQVGYEFTLHFAIDRERIIAEALADGSGHYFRVTNRGTAPVVGVPAREKLVPLLEKYAEAASG